MTNVRITADEKNTNNRRLHVGGDQWCKVYGWDKECVEARAEALKKAMEAPEPRLPCTVDELAQEIRRLNGNNDMGAGALAEALMPFLTNRTEPDTTIGLADTLRREARAMRSVISVLMEEAADKIDATETALFDTRALVCAAAEVGFDEESVRAIFVNNGVITGIIGRVQDWRAAKEETK